MSHLTDPVDLAVMRLRGALLEEQKSIGQARLAMKKAGLKDYNLLPVQVKLSVVRAKMAALRTRRPTKGIK